MRLPTGSGLDRAVECPASTVLPVVGRSTSYSRRGTAIHAFLAEVPAVGYEAALAQVPKEYFDDCAVIEVSSLPACAPESFAPEVAFAYDVRTGEARELGRGLNREYARAGLAETEIAGTIDTVALAADSDAVVVWDYKSGWGYLSPVERNRQLLFAALAAARTYRRSKAYAGIIRLSDDGRPRFEHAVYEASQLDELALELEDLVQRIARDNVEPEKAQARTGWWCNYCGSMPYCSAQMSLVRQLAQPDELAASAGALITPENAPIAWRRLELAEKALTQIRGALKLYAKATPIDLGDGQVVGPVTVRSKVIDGEKAFPVLNETRGADVALAAATIKVSQASLKRGLTPIAKATKVPLAHLIRETLGALEAQGALSFKETEQVKKHKRGEETESEDGT